MKKLLILSAILLAACGSDDNKDEYRDPTLPFFQFSSSENADVNEVLQLPEVEIKKFRKYISELKSEPDYSKDGREETWTYQEEDKTLELRYRTSSDETDPFKGWQLVWIDNPEIAGNKSLFDLVFYPDNQHGVLISHMNPEMKLELRPRGEGELWVTQSSPEGTRLNSYEVYSDGERSGRLFKYDENGVGSAITWSEDIYSYFSSCSYDNDDWHQEVNPADYCQVATSL